MRREQRNPGEENQGGGGVTAVNDECHGYKHNALGAQRGEGLTD